MCSQSIESYPKSIFTPNVQGIKGHSVMMERLRKTLYYGNNKGSSLNDSIECPSMPLTEVTVELFRKVSPGNKGLQVFDMNFVANVSRKSCLSPCSIMMAMIYLERLKRKNPEYLRSVSPCDLFLVSMMIASKFLFDDGEDEEVYNYDWASSGGIDVKEMNRLERDFLSALDWSCYVDPETFLKQLIKVEAAISLQQLKHRCNDEMTYGELLTLLNYSDVMMMSGDTIWSLLTEGVLKVVIVSSIAYWAAALTLITSSSIVISGALIAVHNTHSHNLIISNSLSIHNPIISNSLSVHNPFILGNDTHYISTKQLNIIDTQYNDRINFFNFPPQIDHTKSNDHTKTKTPIVTKCINGQCNYNDIKIQIRKLPNKFNIHHVITRLSVR